MESVRAQGARGEERSKKLGSAREGGGWVSWESWGGWGTRLLPSGLKWISQPFKDRSALPIWTSQYLKVVGAANQTTTIKTWRILKRTRRLWCRKWNCASGLACRNPVLHVPLLGCVTLGRGGWRDEIQNSQLLVSAEVIRKGVGRGGNHLRV